MRSLNSFIENGWASTYKSTNQMWLSDSLNWEKTSTLLISDVNPISALLQSSFINQHVLVDSFSKMSYLDTLLITNNTTNNNQLLAQMFFNDNMLLLNTLNLPLFSSLNSNYQDSISFITFLAPELSSSFMDYFNDIYMNSTMKLNPTAMFDSFTNNVNFYYSEGCVSVALFFMFVWFVIYFFITKTSLKWSKSNNPHFLRFHLYFYSMSRETRIQFEAVSQTIVFFLLYWIMTVMAFDDDQEEVIEFLDTSFFYFFTVVVIYLCYKYSIHYFAFLEASVSEGRTVSFVASQFSKDFLNTFSLMLRFYTLLFRMNVYDTLDDFFDSYYIFVGDFDDDEYLTELFLSIHGNLLFTLDNNDDRSFLFEDENDFHWDLFYIYFVVWGKLFWFIFFIAEEASRLGLAFYITYLIIFEVHSVNSSYKEDNFMLRKKC